MNQQPPLNREGITPEVALQKFEESLLLDKELTLLYRIIKESINTSKTSSQALSTL